MPNVHMQTAAQNLMQAVSDIRQLQHQIRNDTEQAKRDIQQKMNELRAERNLLFSPATNTGNESQDSIKLLRTKNIDQDLKDLDKSLFDVEDEARKQIKSLDDQAVQVENMSRQLQSMA